MGGLTTERSLRSALINHPGRTSSRLESLPRSCVHDGEATVSLEGSLEEHRGRRVQRRVRY